jgi:hypothetical protein
MNLIRIVFFGLAVLLPTSWTVAQAGDEAPAAETKTTKKTKKTKKDGTTEETKEDTKTEKKAQ